MLPNPSPTGRLPRSRLFYFALVLVLGVLFWITYGSFQSHGASDWTYSQLLDQAKAGNVRSIDIQDQVGTAVDRHGVRHHVNLPPDTSSLAAVLSEEGVTVTFNPAVTSNWLAVVVPNVILLVLIGGFIWWMVRRSGPRGPGTQV